MTLTGLERPIKIQNFLPFTFSVTMFMLGERNVYRQWDHQKKLFLGLFAMLMQLFKTDKMNGLFESEAPFRSAELISSDNFGI